MGGTPGLITGVNVTQCVVLEWRGERMGVAEGPKHNSLSGIHVQVGVSESWSPRERVGERGGDSLT